TIFDADGMLVRTVPMASAAEAPIQAAGIDADGAILAREVCVFMAAALQPGQILDDTSQLIQMDVATRARAPQALAPGPVWVWTGHSQVPVPFTISTPFAVSGDALHIAAGCGRPGLSHSGPRGGDVVGDVRRRACASTRDPGSRRGLHRLLHSSDHRPRAAARVPLDDRSSGSAGDAAHSSVGRD